MTAANRVATDAAIATILADGDRYPGARRGGGGLGQNALTRIERGGVSPSFDSLVGVAAGLGISLGELFEAYEQQLARAPR